MFLLSFLQGLEEENQKRVVARILKPEYKELLASVFKFLFSFMLDIYIYIKKKPIKHYFTSCR